MGGGEGVGRWLGGGVAGDLLGGGVAGGGGVGGQALLSHNLGSKVCTKEKDRAPGCGEAGGGGRRTEGRNWCGQDVEGLLAPGDRQGGRAGVTPAPLHGLEAPGILVIRSPVVLGRDEGRVGEVVVHGDTVRREAGSEGRRGWREASSEGRRGGREGSNEGGRGGGGGLAGLVG